MHVLKDVLGHELPSTGNIRRPGPVPKFTDLDLVVLSLTAECMGIDSENLLFNQLNSTYKKDFPFLISRRQYNDRRKSLFWLIEVIRVKLSDKLNEMAEVFCVDSMPLEICKLARAERNTMVKTLEYYSPDKGYCASKKDYYFGYKIHATCSVSGVIKLFDLTKASVHDVHFLNDIRHVFKNSLITGDRGYIGHKDYLWNESRICLETPYRGNQKGKPRIMHELRRIRKRIETVFSQLVDQFMIQRNYAKSFWGYRVRILSKVSGLTILQYINKLNNKPIGRVKYSLL
ncbi:DDE family transposase [Mucilaginibacter gracilis]|uniref:DDE family transposase n=1 Tax=Mucilaginibacter gracilis TaxID=423350 RepID=A0A495J539_9SPHI|nr:IS982 family transposase [Mucilaginibacter gracilis]RKR83099.1 DDE family transposase [Mucilaginibacter gracilis]